MSELGGSMAPKIVFSSNANGACAAATAATAAPERGPLRELIATGPGRFAGLALPVAWLVVASLLTPADARAESMRVVVQNIGAGIRAYACTGATNNGCHAYCAPGTFCPYGPGEPGPPPGDKNTAATSTSFVLPALGAYLADEAGASATWRVLALQEVDRFDTRSGCIDQVGWLGWGAGLAYATHAKTVAKSGCNGANGFYGNALASNYPNDGIAVWRYSDANQGGETRNAIFMRMADVITPARGPSSSLWVVNTHLHHKASEGVAPGQFAELIDVINAYLPQDDVVLIVGDMNIARGGTDYLDRMRPKFSQAGFMELNDSAPTASAWSQHKVIDYALIRDRAHRLSGGSFKVFTSTQHNPQLPSHVPGGATLYLTDHSGLVVDLAWNTPGISPLLVPAAIGGAL